MEEPELKASPTAGGADELLAEPPESSVDGAFAGYQSSKRVRWFVAGALGLGSVAAFAGGTWYVKHLEDQARRGISPTYAEHGDVAPEDRVMHWDSGAARLGLSREPPGVNLIVLPDREIRLADGYHSAQITVRVQDGRTVKLKVVTGRIDVERREPAATAAAGNDASAP